MAQVRHRPILALYVGESFDPVSDYLAYFSPLVGGPSQGYKHLAESSLDWGMDLPGLKTWLDNNPRENREQFYFSYFGSDNPDYYKQLNRPAAFIPGFARHSGLRLGPRRLRHQRHYARQHLRRHSRPLEQKLRGRLPELRQKPPRLQRKRQQSRLRAQLLKQYSPAAWADQYVAYEKLRFARLCAWLRHNKQPIDEVGHSILIWQLSLADINAALHGPPTELADAPLWRENQNSN